MFLLMRRFGALMTIRLLTALITVVMLGCSFNPSLNSLYAGNHGAVANIDVARFGDESKKASTIEEPQVNSGIGKYDFLVEEVQFKGLSFLANGSQAPSVKIIAKNRGYAPVSITVTFDRDISENMAPDVVMPHTSVVLPRSEMVVARFEPKDNLKKWKLHWSYIWSIGDYTTRHICQESYRVPFSDSARAYASVAEESKSTPYTRNAVVFSLPEDAKVLAARKGTVVRIAENNDIDILHDDSTIATYSHLGKIAQGIRVGKAVMAGDAIGFAGKTMDRTYIQLAVWRPEPKLTPTLVDAGNLNFEAVSFPLEFCTDLHDCKVFTRSQSTVSTAAAHDAPKKLVAKSEVGEYDFTVVNDDSEGSQILPDIQRSSKITAINRGHAPVSVTVNFDPSLSDNIRSNVVMPLTSVIPPQTEMVLARLYPKDDRKRMRYSWVSSWSLGDLTTTHRSPEHYRFPFANDIRAFASVADKQKSDPYRRYAVIFSLPAETKILAVRKGIVVKINNNNDLDILHDDSTIATYNHLGKADKDIFVGKTVSAGDTLGIAGKSENSRDSHIQITVWRPEQTPSVSLVKEKAPGFNAVSFPLEFCIDLQDCKELTQNQQIVWNRSKKIKKGLKTH